MGVVQGVALNRNYLPSCFNCSKDYPPSEEKGSLQLCTFFFFIFRTGNYVCAHLILFSYLHFSSLKKDVGDFQKPKERLATDITTQIV